MRARWPLLFLTAMRLAASAQDAIAETVSERIAASGLSIYDAIPDDRPDLRIAADELERLLGEALIGNDYGELALRTRSKAVSQDICRALGYPVPKAFKLSRPRFPGQNFHNYVQKSNNLQIWNEELEATRRYVIIRQGDDGKITRVKVIIGADLRAFDTTGTLTQKYQARLEPAPKTPVELISKQDTPELRAHCRATRAPTASDPTDHPEPDELLPIGDLFAALKGLVGKTFPDAGADQERNRGAALHELVCETLGYDRYADDGRFPDLRHQLLEIKLQTSPTIDLGLVLPSSEAPLDGTVLGEQPVRHCDVRYAIFHAATDGENVRISHVYLTTGQDFFTRFPQFGGRVLNKKLQIRLPETFFDDD